MYSRHPTPIRRPKLSRDGSHCPYCGHLMVKTKSMAPHARSRDHILPEAWGGADTLHRIDGERRPTLNIRYCCKQCNERRGNCGHCVAVLMMIQQVAIDSRTDWSTIYRAWRMHLANAQVTRAVLGYQ
jgi:5-methylcytosine-specific restriction endonuclease McrA